MTDKMKRPSPLDMTRADVEATVGSAALATGLFASRFGKDLERCTQAGRDMLLVRFALTWLLSNSLIVTAPDSAFERPLPMDLPPELAGDVAGRVHEEAARKAHADGISSAADMHLVPARPGDWME